MNDYSTGEQGTPILLNPLLRAEVDSVKLLSNSRILRRVSSLALPKTSFGFVLSGLIPKMAVYASLFQDASPKWQVPRASSFDNPLETGLVCSIALLDSSWYNSKKRFLANRKWSIMRELSSARRASVSNSCFSLERRGKQKFAAQLAHSPRSFRGN